MKKRPAPEMGEDIVRHSRKLEITDPLGFKAPLAYSSSFYFIARKDGVERKYMMYEGDDTNKIDLMHVAPTKESNGVKVIIPVKYGDRYEFLAKIKEQLAYFESVYFDTTGINFGTIPNEFLIHRTDDFQWSELANDRFMHVCLDNVYYPLDFNKLGISHITLPIGLRFSLTDRLFPTPNRESLRYTQEAIAIIKDKIEKVANYFISKYNDSVTVDATIEQVINYYQFKTRRVKMGKDNHDISDLISYGTIPLATPKLKGVELLDLEKVAEVRHIFLFEYGLMHTYNYGKFRSSTNVHGDSIHSANMGSCYVYDETFTNLKKEYIKSLCDSNRTYNFVKKVRKLPLMDPSVFSYNLRSYHSILKLDQYAKKDWRQVIKEYQYIVSMYTNQFIDIDKITIPQSWIDDRKKKRAQVLSVGRRLKLEGEAVGKIAKPLERIVSGKNCKFVPETFKLNELHKLPHLTIYTNHDDSEKLDALFRSSQKHNIKFVTFSEREIKVLKELDIHNLMTYSKFMEGKNLPFKRIVTAYLVKQLISKYRYTFGRVDTLSTISKQLTDKLYNLNTYSTKWYSGDHDSTYQAMLEIANEHKLFDPAIYDTYIEIKNLFEKLPFLEPIMETIKDSHYSTGKVDSSKMVPVLVDLFKYYKYRIDYTNYKLKLNDDVEKVEEEVLTNVVIDELTQTV